MESPEAESSRKAKYEGMAWNQHVIFEFSLASFDSNIIYHHEFVFSRPQSHHMNGGPPKRYVYLVTPKSCQCALFGRRVFADVIS